MTLVDASHTPDHSSPDARDSEAGSTKAPLSLVDRLFIWLKVQRTGLIHQVKGRLGLYKIEARDRMIDGTRRDQDALVKAFNENLKQEERLTRHIHYLASRLAFYEEHIPRMRELRKQFDQEQREQVEALAKDQRESQAAHENGILMLPGKNGRRRILTS